MTEEQYKETVEVLTRKNILLQELLAGMLEELSQKCAAASCKNVKSAHREAHRCELFSIVLDGSGRCGGERYSTCATWAIICKAREWRLNNEEAK